MKRIKGLMLGLASGAAFGVLFAPRKGKDLRNKIKKERESGGTGFNAVKGDLKVMGDDFLDTVQVLTENEEVQSALSKGKEKFYEVTGMTEDDVESLAKKARAQAQKLSKMAEDLKKEGNKKKTEVKNAVTKAKKIITKTKKDTK